MKRKMNAKGDQRNEGWELTNGEEVVRERLGYNLGKKKGGKNKVKYLII